MSEPVATIKVIKFWREYKTDAKGQSRPIEWVAITPLGSPKSVTHHRVKDIIPPERVMKGDQKGEKARFMKFRWAQIEPFYKAWKNDEEMPETGTPLGAWPAINADIAVELRKLGIRSVEEFRDMPENAVTKLPVPNPRELRKQAVLFLDNQDKTQAAAEMANRDSKIAELEEKLAAAMELLDEATKGKKPAPKADKDKEAA